MAAAAAKDSAIFEDALTAMDELTARSQPTVRDMVRGVGEDIMDPINVSTKEAPRRERKKAISEAADRKSVV